MKKNCLKFILILVVSLQVTSFSIEDIILKFNDIPSLIPKQKDNPLKEQALDLIDKYSGLVKKTIDWIASLDDSVCAYRLEQLAVKAAVKQMDNVDNSVFKLSGHFPQILGKYDQCIHDKNLNMTYHLLTIGSSDLRLGFGLCLPNECSHKEMAKTSDFLMNVTSDLINAHIITYKLPLRSLYPYETVVFATHRGDDPKIYYFTWISIAL